MGRTEIYTIILWLIILHFVFRNQISVIVRAHGFQGKAGEEIGEEIILKPQENMKPWITSLSRHGEHLGIP